MQKRKDRNVKAWLAKKDPEKVKQAKKQMAAAIAEHVPGGMDFMRDLARLCPGSLPIQVVVDGNVVADLVELVK